MSICQQSRRAAFHFHFTPKHGCWLNMAQIEFSVLARQCFASRIDAILILEEQVLQGSKERNEQKATIHWSFTVNTARLKLACQYVKVNESNTTSNSYLGRVLVEYEIMIKVLLGALDNSLLDQTEGCPGQDNHRPGG